MQVLRHSNALLSLISSVGGTRKALNFLRKKIRAFRVLSQKMLEIRVKECVILPFLTLSGGYHVCRNRMSWDLPNVTDIRAVRLKHVFLAFVEPFRDAWFFPLLEERVLRGLLKHFGEYFWRV